MKTSYKIISSLMVMGIITSCFADANTDGQKALAHKNYSEAVTDFAKSCDNGNPKGCFNLGSMYEHAEGVAQNKYEAAALYTKACRGGETLGCSNMTLSYDTP